MLKVPNRWERRLHPPEPCQGRRSSWLERQVLLLHAQTRAGVAGLDFPEAHPGLAARVFDELAAGRERAAVELLGQVRGLAGDGVELAALGLQRRDRFLKG